MVLEKSIAILFLFTAASVDELKIKEALLSAVRECQHLNFNPHPTYIVFDMVDHP